MPVSLKREVSLFGLIIYGIGIIFGAGIYALVGEAAAMTGNSVWFSFLLAAFISSFTGLSYAELSSIYPKSAAEYHFVKKAFTNNLLAFLAGWIEIFADIIAASAVSLAFAGYFHAIFGFPIVLTALGLIAVLSFINFWGIKESTKTNFIFTLVEVFGLLLIIFLGINYFGTVNYFELPYGFTGVLGASALIFFAYLGFEDIVNIAEETKKPKKTIPEALIASIAITSIIYVLVAISAVSLADWKELAVSTAPLAFAASKALGPIAFNVMSVIALFATTNTVLILLIVGSRQMYSISKDKALPKILSKVHKKRRTPWVSVIASMFFTMLFVLSGSIKFVASITNFGTFLIFALVNLSLILLRYRKPNIKRPFKLPLNIGKFPLIPFFGLLSCMFMIYYLDVSAVLLGIFILILGVVIYFVLKKK